MKQCFPLKRSIWRNVTQMLPSIYPCASPPHAAAIQCISLHPSWLSPLSPSSPRLLGRAAAPSGGALGGRNEGHNNNHGDGAVDGLTAVYGKPGTGKRGRVKPVYGNHRCHPWMLQSSLSAENESACSEPSGSQQRLEIISEWSPRAGNLWRVKLLVVGSGCFLACLFVLVQLMEAWWWWCWCAVRFLRQMFSRLVILRVHVWTLTGLWASDIVHTVHAASQQTVFKTPGSACTSSSHSKWVSSMFAGGRVVTACLALQFDLAAFLFFH